MKTIKIGHIILAAVALFGVIFTDICPGAILFPDGPNGGQQAVMRRIKWTLISNPEFLEDLQTNNLALTNSFKTYTCSLTNINDEKFLSGETFISWNYFVVSSNKAVAQATFRYDGNIIKDIELSSAPVRAFIGLQKALNLQQVKMKDYEFRLIRIPEISFSAIWLCDGTDDIIMPIPPCYNNINAYQPYSERQITSLLMPAIKTK
jgi:hypothetical protein